MSSLVKVVSICIATFLCAAFALGTEVQINASEYNIYKGDLDGDGDSDFYFSQKPFFIILHGDIATPLLISGSKNYAVYDDAGTYLDPVSFSISSELLASRIATGLFEFAIWDVDIFMGLDGNSVSVPNSNSNSNNIATTTYTYDALGRLTFVSDVNGNRDYDYDKAGNRVEVTLGTSSDEISWPVLPAPVIQSCSTVAAGAYRGRWNSVPGAVAYMYRTQAGPETLVVGLESSVYTSSCKWVRACSSTNPLSCNGIKANF